MLNVPYYTVFHQYNTAGPTTLYLKCIAPNPSVVLNFSCLKVTQVSSTERSFCACTFKGVFGLIVLLQHVFRDKAQTRGCRMLL